MKLKHRLFRYFLKEPTKVACHRVLLEWNSYYRGLSRGRKEAFVIRTMWFESVTSFSAKPGFEVLPEMKYLISSAFTQITFGLDQDSLDYFDEIHITPTSYSYSHSEVLFDGDVNPMTRSVNLTWPVVQRGFAINDDGLNLAIHEFAHCIILENARANYLFRIFNEQALDDWKSHGVEVIDLIRKGENSLFREYGGRNLMELFATSLEYFFEKPGDLNSFDPAYYRKLSRLLRQDPRNALDPTKGNGAP